MDHSILRGKVVDHGVGKVTVIAVCMVFVSRVSRSVLGVTEMGWSLSAKNSSRGSQDCEGQMWKREHVAIAGLSWCSCCHPNKHQPQSTRQQPQPCFCSKWMSDISSGPTSKLDSMAGTLDRDVQRFAVRNRLCLWRARIPNDIPLGSWSPRNKDNTGLTQTLQHQV